MIRACLPSRFGTPGLLQEGLFVVQDETLRIMALRRAELLDSEPEEQFDELVKLAAEICGTPISLFSLVDENRQWFKAAVGLAVPETGRDVSFCSHAIQQDDIFEITDATTDARFGDNALVTGDPHIRFYAGMPVCAPDGSKLGTLCVIDRVPRTLSESQTAALQVLGRQVTARLELREQQLRLTEALREKEALLEELWLSEHRFRTFMDSAPFISLMKDGEGRMVYYNRRLSEQFGFEGDAWLGKSDSELWDEDLAREFRKNDLEVLQAGHMIEQTEVTRSADGTSATWRSYKFPLRNVHGDPMIGLIAVDITTDMERERALTAANTQLAQLATIDGLTGILNRRALDERAEVEFELAGRLGRPFTIVLLDLDNFKSRNDRFGHQSGDEVLRLLGNLIRTMLRSSHLAGRYGGEELALLLPGTEEEGARQFCEKIRTAMRGIQWPDGQLTASFGVAARGPDTGSVKRLFELADKAMYHGKKTSKDKVVTHQQMLALCAAEARLAIVEPSGVSHPDHNATWL